MSSPENVQSQDDSHDDSAEQACLSQDVTALIDERARGLLAEGKLSLDTCTAFLRELDLAWHRTSQRQTSMVKGQYVMFGMYTRGPFSGVSNTAKDMPNVIRYLNAVLKNAAEQVGSDAQTWTSISIGLNAGSTLHRDCHNCPDTRNLIVGLGEYQGGELWRACQPHEEDLKGPHARWKVQKNGSRIRGVQIPTLNQVVTFDPSLPHATCKWTGRRYVISTYTVRDAKQNDVSLRQDLRKLGFPVPQVQCQAHVVSPPVVPGEQEQEPWQTTKPLSSEIRATMMQHAQEYVDAIDEITHIFPRCEPKPMCLLEVGKPSEHLREAMQGRAWDSPQFERSRT